MKPARVAWAGSLGHRHHRLHGTPEIFNSDQGSQFTSKAFTDVLKAAGVAISMDGRGRAFDHIFVERLWRTLKYEDIYLKGYASLGELTIGLADYFAFYNAERPHQSMGYRTPDEVYLRRRGCRCQHSRSLRWTRGCLSERRNRAALYRCEHGRGISLNSGKFCLDHGVHFTAGGHLLLLLHRGTDVPFGSAGFNRQICCVPSRPRPWRVRHVGEASSLQNAGGNGGSIA